MIHQELKYWAGMIASGVGALIAAGVLPHPFDKYAMGVFAFAGAIAAFNITPPGSQRQP